MSNTIITKTAAGDVIVTHNYFDGFNDISDSATYTAVGQYVHQIYPNGTTGQVCDGLRSRGPTLLLIDGDLEKTIRNTLS